MIFLLYQLGRAVHWTCSVQALLLRHSMHIDQVRKVPGVPGQPQQTFFRFLAADTSSHAHRFYIFGADLGFAQCRRRPSQRAPASALAPGRPTPASTPS